MTIESQLDALILQGTKTNDLLQEVVDILKTDAPTPVPPVPQPGEELLFSEYGWEATDFGAAAEGKKWRYIERPAEGTLSANLTFVAGKLRFNKKPTQAAGYGSSVIARNFPAATLISKLRVKQQVTYKGNWATPNGCKHAFWSTQSGTNHCFASFNNYDGKIRPSVLLQQPFFNYYCDFVVVKDVPYMFEWIADFKNKTLEMIIDQVPRKINQTSWAAPSTLKVINVNYGFSELAYQQYQIDPTEPACPDGVNEMSHEYGPVEVYGTKVA